MKKLVAVTILVASMFMMTACSEKEAIKPYARSKETKEETKEEIREEKDISINSEHDTEDSEQDTEEHSEQDIEQSLEQNEIDDSTEQENLLENYESGSEVRSEEGDTSQDDIIDNGAISDINLSMGSAYMGNITIDKIVTEFPSLSNYENNELTQQVVESVQDYLDNYSEYKLINLWNDYDTLEKHQRYALITLTTYKQAFGGYNKTSMQNALKESQTYKDDLNSINTDLK